MWGLCLGQKRAKFLLFLLYHCFYLFEMFQNLTKISWETNRLLNYWSHVGAMFGPFWTILDHVWPSFPFRPARALKFSILGKYGLSNISIECLLFGTISGPCWDNVCPIFTSWPAKALKFWGLSQHGIKHMSSKYQFWGHIRARTMLGPYLSEFYIQTKKSPKIRNAGSIWSWVICLLIAYFLRWCQGHVWTMLEPCMA